MFELQKTKREIVIAGFHCLYQFEFTKTFTHTPEAHDFWEMVYVDKGDVIAVTDGVGCRLGQGQAIFHQPGEMHAHVSDQKVSNSMLVVGFRCTSPAIKHLRKKTFTLDKTEKTLLGLFTQEARLALGSIPDDYQIKTAPSFQRAPFGSTQLLECYFTELLIRLIRKGNHDTEPIEHTPQARAVGENTLSQLMSDFMRQQIFSNLTLPDLCAHFHLGKSQLCKIFSENAGCSPMAYYRSLQMDAAKQMLREKEYTVTEIAAKLGYADLFSFSRAFKKAFGFSPTTYQNSIL